jgi:hypothetical protein
MVPPISTIYDIHAVGQLLDAVFNFIRDVRDHLNGSPQIISTPLFEITES